MKIIEGKNIKKLILINLKSHDTSVGNNALKIGSICQELYEVYGLNIGVAPQLPDIYRLSSKLNIPVFSQHIDNIKNGTSTGYTTIRCIKEAGAIGSIINHSEHPIFLSDVSSIVSSLKKYKLESIVCAEKIEDVKLIFDIDPDYIAFEPIESIGKSGSLSNQNKISIENILNYIDKNKYKNIKLMFGGGINKPEDVKRIFDMGVSGILISSLIIKSKDKYKTLENLICKL